MPKEGGVIMPKNGHKRIYTAYRDFFNNCFFKPGIAQEEGYTFRRFYIDGHSFTSKGCFGSLRQRYFKNLDTMRVWLEEQVEVERLERVEV